MAQRVEDGGGVVQSDRRKVCPACRGGKQQRTPTDRGFKVEPCTTCQGTGYVTKEGWER